MLCVSAELKKPSPPSSASSLLNKSTTRVKLLHNQWVNVDEHISIQHIHSVHCILIYFITSELVTVKVCLKAALQFLSGTD